MTESITLSKEWDKVFAKSDKVDNKKLLTVEGATHTDLYDQKDRIPFDQIEAFIRGNM